MLNTRKDKKLSTDELPTRFAVEFFLSYESLKSRKRRILFRRATYKGTYVEAVESTRVGLSPKEGDVRNKK